MRTLQPVILSGGSGTRLWPLSRSTHPKQFLELLGDDSLLQSTAARLGGLKDSTVSPTFVVCNEQHRFLVAEQLAVAGHRVGRILLEPEGRNTAPALALAAIVALQGGDDPVLVVMPADHTMSNPEAFREAVSVGMDYAERGSVVTFGIVPTAPETGFGYLRCGRQLDRGNGGHQDVRRLSAFVEKPDRETAVGYLTSGDYLWNSGIFMLRASLWLDLLDRFQPAILQTAQAACAGGLLDGDFLHLDAEAFAGCPSNSIDYAVMEPLAAAGDDNLVVVPLDAG